MDIKIIQFVLKVIWYFLSRTLLFKILNKDCIWNTTFVYKYIYLKKILLWDSLYVFSSLIVFYKNIINYFIKILYINKINPFLVRRLKKMTNTYQLIIKNIFFTKYFFIVLIVKIRIFFLDNYSIFPFSFYSPFS